MNRNRQTGFYMHSGDQKDNDTYVWALKAANGANSELSSLRHTTAHLHDNNVFLPEPQRSSVFILKKVDFKERSGSVS